MGLLDHNDNKPFHVSVEDDDSQENEDLSQNEGLSQQPKQGSLGKAIGTFLKVNLEINDSVSNVVQIYL